MEVHKQLGNGFLDPVYQEALEIELIEWNILFVREAELTINYKGVVLKKHYYADFICHNEIKSYTFFPAIAEITYSYSSCIGSRTGSECCT